MPTATRKLVYAMLDGERDYQDLLWGSTFTEGQHSAGEYLVYIQDYLTEAMHQATRAPEPESTQNVLHTIRKITAMGVACMEQNGAPPRMPKPLSHVLP